MELDLDIKNYSYEALSEFSEKVGRGIRGEIVDEPGVQEAVLSTRKFLKDFGEVITIRDIQIFLMKSIF